MKGNTAAEKRGAQDALLSYMAAAGLSRSTNNSAPDLSRAAVVISRMAPPSAIFASGFRKGGA